MKSAEIYVVANGSTIRVFRRRTGNPVLENEPFHLDEVLIDSSINLPTKEDSGSSDRAGRFESGDRIGIGNNLVHGERHGVKQEAGRRQGRALAEAVEKIIRQEDPGSWALLAPQKWLSLIAEGLSDTSAKKLVARDASDLTKLSLRDLEERVLS